MAEMIQMLDGLSLNACACSGGKRSRYSPLLGLGADLNTSTTVESSATGEARTSFYERHETAIKLGAVAALGLWWMKIRRDRASYRSGTREFRAMEKARRGKRSGGRTTSGAWMINA